MTASPHETLLPAAETGLDGDATSWTSSTTHCAFTSTSDDPSSAFQRSVREVCRFPAQVAL